MPRNPFAASFAYPNQSENVSFAYDDLSRMTNATNENGAVSFNYDNRGRLASTTNGFGQTVAYNFDENGNRTNLSLNNANYASYVYDAANRLTQITATSDNASITFGYDNANRLTSKSLPNGVATMYHYDAMSRIKRLTDASGAGQLFDRQYAYNQASQISQIAESTNTRNFSYDNLDRLTSVAAASSANESYAFDAVGNRISSHLSANYTHNSFNRLTSANGATFAYDNNGNMISKTDASGTWSYEWDYENRLKKATRPDGQFVVYKYDALGRRIERSMSGGAWTRFNYDGQDVILDQNSDGTNVSYLNGLGIDNKLRQVVNGQAQYFIADHLGSTTALTNAAGEIVSQTGYDSFGNQTNSLATRYGYTGRERDDFTRMMYHRARWYSPQLGRFMSEDPIGFMGGDVNIYAYVSNNALGFTDPTGLQPNDGLEFLPPGSAYGEKWYKRIQNDFNDMKRGGCECRKSFEEFDINLDDLSSKGIVVGSGEPIDEGLRSKLTPEELNDAQSHGGARAFTMRFGYDPRPHIFLNWSGSRGLWGDYGNPCAVRETFAHELMHAGDVQGVKRGTLTGNSYIDYVPQTLMAWAGYDDLTYKNGWWDKPYNRLLKNCGCQ